MLLLYKRKVGGEKNHQRCFDFSFLKEKKKKRKSKLEYTLNEKAIP